MYKIIDFLIPAIIGGFTGLCTFWIVSPSWNMLFAMVIGMLLGMVIQVFILVFAMPLFGSFEIMIPSMLTGMISGMIHGMLAAKYSFPSGTVFLVGGGMGLLLGLWIWILNRKLHGETV